MPSFKQQIRFCTGQDGVRIAYATSGRGPPLVKANWLSHLEFDVGSPVWSHLLTELSRHHTLIRYDERGCGLSDRDVADLSFDAWLHDLEAWLTRRRSSGFRCSASPRALSEKTVRNHITRIFSKLEVENRPQAIVMARKAGFGKLLT